MVVPSRFRFGILAKMGLAFAVIAAMAIVTEVVVWLSFRGIESELASVIDNAVPAMTTAEAMAVEATAVAAATGTLAAAQTEEQRLLLMTTLASRVADLNARLDELQRRNVEKLVIANLHGRIDELERNLHHQSNLVAERIAIDSVINNSAAELAINHKRFLQVVAPQTDQTYRELFAGIKTLVDDLGSPDKTTPSSNAPASYQDMVVLQRRIGQLFNHSVGEMMALLELAAAGNLAAGLLNEVIRVTDPVQVRQLRSQFNEVTIAMGDIRLNLATTAKDQALLALTTPLLRYGLGVGNLFDQRLHVLDLMRASEQVVTENRQLSEALTVAVDTLVDNTRSATRSSAKEVQADAANARLIQALTTGLAAIIALLIGWRYFGRGVIGRILALRQAMEAEAEGREIVISAAGDDEISAMAHALSHFVNRRKQAETELRAAKEQAERAFAELKDVQATLIQAEKMAALGGLVAGVAHELNTPIGVCLTAITLLSEQTDTFARAFKDGQLRKSTVQDYLKGSSEITSLICTNLDRAGELVRVFKQVANDHSENDRHLFPVREQIDLVISLLAGLVRSSGALVAVECSPDLFINSFPDALRQVLTELLENALIHGLGIEHPGTITISAIEAGSNVVLGIADQGVGIQPEDQHRLFEPFFTTRRHRGSIGLGLHMTFNLVCGVLGGRITVESQPGQGTRVILTLPTISPVALGSRHAGLDG